MARNHKHSVIVLETLSRSSVWCIALLCLTCFGGLCFVGYEYGPQLYKQREITEEPVRMNDFTWTMKLRSMTQKHRNLDVTAKFRAKALKLAFPTLKQNLYWMDERINADVTVSVCGLTEHQVFRDGDRFNYGYEHDTFFDPTRRCMGRWLVRNFTHPMHIRCHASSFEKEDGSSTEKQGMTGEEWCHATNLLHFTEVAYAGYDVVAEFDAKAFGKNVDEVEFWVRYGNVAETYYLMAFKYCFVLLSVIAYALYSCALADVPKSQRSVEQWMLQVLAALLPFFNDPLYALEMWKGNALLGVLSVMFKTTFMAALLLFWLILVDHIRVEAMEARIQRKSFYPAKLLFMGVYWLSTVVVECYNLMERRDNPAYNIHIDFHAFRVIRIVGIVAIVLYCVWMLLMVCVLSVEIRSLTRRFQFLLLFSGLMGVAAVVGIVLGHLGHMNHNMAELTGYYSLFNLYVFTLCYLYCPSKEPAARYGTVSSNASDVHGYGQPPSQSVDVDDYFDSAVSGVEMTGV
eukprot:g6704.t1